MSHLGAVPLRGSGGVASDQAKVPAGVEVVALADFTIRSWDESTGRTRFLRKLSISKKSLHSLPI